MDWDDICDKIVAIIVLLNMVLFTIGLGDLVILLTRQVIGG